MWDPDGRCWVTNGELVCGRDGNVVIDIETNETIHRKCSGSRCHERRVGPDGSTRETSSSRWANPVSTVPIVVLENRAVEANEALTQAVYDHLTDHGYGSADTVVANSYVSGGGLCESVRGTQLWAIDLGCGAVDSVVGTAVGVYNLKDLTVGDLEGIGTASYLCLEFGECGTFVDGARQQYDDFVDRCSTYGVRNCVGYLAPALIEAIAGTKGGVQVSRALNAVAEVGDLAPVGRLDAPRLPGRGADVVVIGKVDDLNATTLAPGERTLLDQLPDQGSPAANYAQNDSVLRNEMSRGVPIRDASVSPTTGELVNNTGFLRAERDILSNHGWSFDPKSGYWLPPG